MYHVARMPKAGCIPAYRKFKTLSAVKKSIDTGWFKAEIGDEFRVIKSMKQANDSLVPVYMWNGEKLVKVKSKFFMPMW
tara:strand:+ start:4488 stop:4724 length:237 start_codon:yes stop_codon:yes gene_type:complete